SRASWRCRSASTGRRRKSAATRRIEQAGPCNAVAAARVAHAKPIARRAGPRYIGTMTSAAVPDILRIAVAQLNPTVGDIAGNLAKAREARADAARSGADLVLFTELFIAGYPP